MRDPLFKGCTRPAMLLGVPATSLALCSGAIALLCVWISIAFLALFPVLLLTMRIMIRRDDQQFRLIWLYLRMRWLSLDRTHAFWRSAAYAPLRMTTRRRRVRVP
ncbi:type IV secretion system protein VirB3 [Bordetella bronchiseptica]|uniref:type IV secretion system protein VirB3 n=1 Tax=Bordetella bronchiseptica TaxID=518 RepID=UPI00045B995D|nr:VirB3 family type IV secretion system protein [Bordetella bronchiseptica]AOB28964.1 Type IV secretion system protein PtlB [Bordetella bronchiseptica]AZW46321.1 Type IV secretion system protein PtlB [Bordetella bronchiseptica]KCV59139.1 type IV secretory pathway, VirB3-like protein [Bordetella bronchiseptica 99-R-0433]MBN3267212.1 Type IV secretion system protein PtlB [Bordetella bronchiseptica]